MNDKAALILGIAQSFGLNMNILDHIKSRMSVSDWKHSDDHVKNALEKRMRKASKRKLK